MPRNDSSRRHRFTSAKPSPPPPPGAAATETETATTSSRLPLRKQPTPPQQQSHIIIRSFLVATLAWLVQRYCWNFFLPYGPAVRLKERYSFRLVDHANDSLQAKHGKLQKIYERVTAPSDGSSLPLMVKGPETVLFDAHGVMHVMTEDAKLVSLTDLDVQPDGITVLATAREVAHLGVGRPLGGCFHPLDGGSLYIADAHLGLMRLPPPPKTKKGNASFVNSNKVELIASRVRDMNGDWSPLHYVDDVVVGPKTGRVFFTDATDITPDRVKSTTWDVLYSAKLDSLRGKRNGRLLMYDPKTDQVSVLAQDLFFPNGIGIDRDETYLFFAETFALRLNVYDLATGQLHTVDGDLPGYPDGAACSTDQRTATTITTCYAAIISAVVPVHRLLNVLPHPVDVMLRTLLMMLPRFLAPPAQPYGGVVEVDAKTRKIRRIIQDPSAKDIGMLTGVTVHDNKLYLGSLDNDFIGVYDLKAE